MAHGLYLYILFWITNYYALSLIGNGSESSNSYYNSGGMQIGKLSAGILNMKIDTFDSRTTPSEGTIPGLAIGAGNPLGLPTGGKSKNAKKKVRRIRK